MEGREPGTQDAAGTMRKRWPPAVLLLIVVIAVGWWWQSQPASDATASALSRPSLAAGAGTRHDTPGDLAIPGAATIVDEALPAPSASTLADVPHGGDGNNDLADPSINPMTIMGQPGVAPARAATAHSTSADGTSNPFLIAATPPAVAAKPVASRPPSRNRGRSANNDEPALLAILLGNIKPGQPPDDSHGSGLDALLQTMDADSPGVASAERNRNGRPQRTRSQQIQQNLRACPAANTAKGLKCRQEICAVYAGRDPACPANG